VLWEIVTKKKKVREWIALHPLTLKIPNGQVVGIVGANGAGKSTLLKLIAGTLNPSSGEIHVRGPVAALLELGAGFHPDMSGRENVYLGGSVMGLPASRMKQLYTEIVDFAGLEGFMDQPVKTYSSGMYARLAFAVATAADPDILILDETLSVGDGAFARKSFDRITGYKKAGKTILFCSHNLYQVEAICNRVIWLDRGRLIMDGEPARVTAAYAEFLKSLERGVAGGGERAPPFSPKEGSVRLTGVEVSADGIAGQELSIETGETDLGIRVSFESEPALPPPNVGVTILDASGWAVTSASTENDGVAPQRRESGQGEVHLTFPRLPLLKGNYWVNVFLLCENGIHVYDRAERVAELRVAQKGLERGVVTLPRQWSCAKPKRDSLPLRQQM
jgi:lipopolysaccharide transport system ATP-binding protein